MRPDREALDTAFRVGPPDLLDGRVQIANALPEEGVVQVLTVRGVDEDRDGRASVSRTSAPGEPVARYRHEWMRVATERSNSSSSERSGDMARR